ncbi:MAG: hydroxymethylbilane synthase [Chlamydiae bacterium]|nr:hydroxymethylbilane synthase [Chlamydiota bacterium]
MSFFLSPIPVAARASMLSRAQVEEVLMRLKIFYPESTFMPLWLSTSGDLDLQSSLLTKEKTDFFTKEVDEAVLQGKCRVGIHSAKDLPEIPPRGLCVIAYTKCLDPHDVLVFRQGDSLTSFSESFRIGTSSQRRKEFLAQHYPRAELLDIRGTIERRLFLLDTGAFDAVVMARAALLRLHIQRDQVLLPCPTAPMQGRLAITAREEDEEMRELFACIHEFS